MNEILQYLAAQDAPMQDAPVLAASIFDLGKLLTYWNALLIVSVWTIIQAGRRVLPESEVVKRLLPLAAIIGCNIAVWIPGPWLSPDETWGQRAVLGTVLGALTANFHSVASKFGLHDFLKIEPKTKMQRLAKKV